MLKVLFGAVLALSLGLLLAFPASAAQKQISREAEEICFDELVECVVGCTHLTDDAEFGVCNQDCNDDFGICTRGDAVASSGGAAGQAGQSTAGVLGTPKKGPHTTAVGAIGAADLERACNAVDGIFDRTSNVVGCVNQSCEKGNCSLVCFGGKCFALTPDPLPERVTLLGILQGGSMVLHDPQGTGQSLSSPGGDAATSTAPPASKPDPVIPPIL